MVFPLSSVKFVETIASRAVVERQNILADEIVKNPAMSSVRIFITSEWKKLDLSTYNFYSYFYDHPCRDEPNLLTI